MTRSSARAGLALALVVGGGQLAEAQALRSGPVTAAERAFWSFQPITDPTPPAVAPSLPVRNEIDRFLFAKLEVAGLKPRDAADRRTLLRRATFDLTGLPPTPEETQAFLHDAAPDAFSRVVERLLNSRAYGERWGRHWLDVVRYADTAGETADYPTPLAYKYRNWVIDAFNADEPYDEFLREQLAGDLLSQKRPEAPAEEHKRLRTATGFIAISRRFGFDVENYHYLTIQDTIDTVGQAVLGLTLGCARCHDHKYDPVSVGDYTAWYGIFESTRYSFPGSEEKKKPYDSFAVLPPQLLGEKKTTEELIYAAIDVEKPKDAQVQLRGEKSKLGETVARRNLELLGGEAVPPGAGSGRLELAEWLTRPSNSLTARVMANRIWQHHFGRGLVATANDFGTRGERPSHPELLDWLASRFVEGGWRVKAMHRLIMASWAYQQSSEHDAHAAEIDPNAKLLWRFNRRRLSAEEIRDAMLAASGDLDGTMGGGHPFPPVEQWGFTQHSPYYGVYPTNRRSVYLMQQRLKRHPFLSLFDGADGNVSTSRREATTVPTQALYLMNSDFVHERAESMARRMLFGPGTEAERITKAFAVALGRTVDADEMNAAAAFLASHCAAQAASPDGAARTEGERILAAWCAFARTLLTRNEFLFVD